MIEKQLNTFQVYLLRQLSPHYPKAVSIRHYKSAWLTNNLTGTEEIADQWISELIKGKFIEEPEQQGPVLYNFFKELDSRNALYEYAITQKGRDYLHSPDRINPSSKKTGDVKQNVKVPVVDNDVQNPVETPSLQEINVATDIEQLTFLRKKWQGSTIMNKKDYDRLTDYTTYLLKHNAIPKPIQKIQRLDVSSECITGAYFEIWSKHRKTVDRTKIVKFLRKVFDQFDTRSEKTIYNKFSQYKNNYEQIKSLVE